MDRLFQPSTSDRIIGSHEKARATKTYISSEKGAFIVAAIKTHSEGLIETVRRLHRTQYGYVSEVKDGKAVLRDLTDEEVCERYKGCRLWREFHQFIVEHYASQEGFAIQAAVQMYAKEAVAKERAESSVDAKGDKPE